MNLVMHAYGPKCQLGVSDAPRKRVRVNGEAAQPLRADQFNACKQDSASKLELRVLQKDLRLGRDLQVVASPCGFQVLPHDAPDSRRSFLNPNKRYGLALAAEELLH